MDTIYNTVEECGYPPSTSLFQNKFCNVKLVKDTSLICFTVDHEGVHYSLLFLTFKGGKWTL